MRLKPAVTAEEAYHQLSVTAALTYGLAEAAQLETYLRTIAEAMAIVSAIDVPEDTEPLFGGHEIFEPLEEGT